MRLTQQQLEAHLWGAANILRGKTAGQDYKNYILSLMFYKRLCDQWENEADEAIAVLEQQQGRAFTEAQKAIFRARGEHRFNIPDGSRWGDVLAVSGNIGREADGGHAGGRQRQRGTPGVFTVDWNQPAPDGSGKPLIPNEVVHALIQHFDEHDLSNRSVPPDVLGRAYEYLIKQFADDAGAKAGEFFTPPEVVDTLVRILEPRPGDTIYDPTAGSGGMLVHAADLSARAGPSRHVGPVLRPGNELGQRRHRQDQLGVARTGGPHRGGRQHDHRSGVQDAEGKVRPFSLVLANFPFSDEFWWLKPEQQTDDKKKKDKLKKEVFGKEGYKDPFGRFGRGTAVPGAARRLRRLRLHPAHLASLTDHGRAGIVCPQGCCFAGSRKWRRRPASSTTMATRSSSAARPTTSI
jgi:type I restriction enzyme M protein